MQNLTRASVGCVVALAFAAGPSFAQTDSTVPAPSPSAPPPAPVQATVPAPPKGTDTVPRSGVVVVARHGAENAAWALAGEIYAHDALRPSGLDETRARVLVGDPAPPGAAQPVRDLADERAGIHGDDGASRALLLMIATQLGVRGVVMVESTPTGEASARIFFVDAQAFDAARYAPDASAPFASPAPAPEAAPDAGASTAAVQASDAGMSALSPQPPVPPAPPPVHWTGAVSSIERAFAAGAAPSLALAPVPPLKPHPTESHAFYTSPWFWGAVGAAVFGGTAVYFATRDNSTSTIHLDLQVPK